LTTNHYFCPVTLERGGQAWTTLIFVERKLDENFEGKSRIMANIIKLQNYKKMTPKYV